MTRFESMQKHTPKGLLVVAGAGIAALITAACTGGGGDDSSSDAGASPTADNGEETSTERESLPGSLEGLAEVWNTDWSKRTIDLGELLRGRPETDPRDTIPPLDNPASETVTEADEYLEDREPGVLFQLDGEARFYPLRILTWHEIVNDEVAGRPVVITFCPLCNSALAFERTVDGQVLRFGVSGLLRFSNVVMWDDKTESLWGQITGEAIVGDMVGATLEFLPSSIIPWDEFKERFPEGEVLSRNTGFARNYGQNPYVGCATCLALFNGESDDRFPALERVVGVIVNGQDKAYPFSVISEERAANDEVAGVPIAVLWGAPDTADALDTASIPEGRAVGTGVAFERTVDGQVLTFTPSGDDTFVDAETGTTWDLLGLATAGPMAGTQLTPVIHTNDFWFAWAAFHPDDPVYTGAGG